MAARNTFFIQPLKKFSYTVEIEFFLSRIADYINHEKHEKKDFTTENTEE